MKNSDKLLEIFTDVLNNNDLKSINELNPNDSLRDDLGLDSLALAELTVKIENEFGVDIFEDEIIESVYEVIIKTNV